MQTLLIQSVTPVKLAAYFKFHWNPASLFYSITLFFYKAQDPVVEKLYESTEEGQKVTRNSGVKLVVVFRRIQDSYGQ